MGMCLKYGDLIYDVIMDLFGIIFRNFYYQENCMIIGFDLIDNFNSYRLKPNFSRGKKLLHVFWNTLYIFNYIIALPIFKQFFSVQCNVYKLNLTTSK